MRVVHWIL